ncbi:MAG: hypothetical protein J0H14_09025 [Alphaproteobacteria bacterium]|nr:hypothetical protein [Alphaproteobacteria bacterium]
MTPPLPGVPPSSSPYDWPRFWIPQTGILDLSDAGFLRGPVDSLYGPGPLRTLAQLEACPALALLGEPGIGKSASLRAEHHRLSGPPLRGDLQPVYVDLNSTSSEERLYRLIFESPEVAAWKSGNSRLCLLLDSLDEAMLRIETVPHLLTQGIKELPADRLSVRFACRTAVWPAATLGRSLASIWGDAGFGVFELAPLRRRDVVTALIANEIDPDEFIPKLFGAQAVAFAIKPLTLKMLIALYKRDGRLPISTGDLYRQGCLALCEETNDSRQDTGRQGRLNGRQRMRVAGRIAVATALGNRGAVWNGPESEAPSEDAAISALSAGREEGDFAGFTTSDQDVREILNTGLFTARGDRRMGWAHQSYQEFLAANYLVAEKRVPPHTILKALTHPNGGLIPPLAIIAAWAASLSPEIRTSLIATDPWTLLRGDLTKWASTDLAALIGSLLGWVEQGHHFDYFFGITETYEKLKHPNLAGQLRVVIIDPARKSITRRMALAIAERCELKELQPELLAVALDRGEDPTARAGAVAALKECGDESTPAHILAMLQSGIGLDPAADICGNALDLLWPSHITADQLFSFLAPSDEHYVGSYAHFLFDLPRSLEGQHLASALTWATTYIRASNLMGEFRNKTLADAIMFKAWGVFEDPALTAPFMEHVAARLHQYGELCRGTDYKAIEAFIETLHADTARRRQFVLRLCQKEMDRLAALPYIRAGFVRNDDLEWILAISPGGDTPAQGVSEQSLCSLISLLVNVEDNAHFESLYPVCQRWPLLHAYYRSLIDGVLIASAEAAQARDFQRQVQEMQHPAPPPAVANIPAEIEGLLTRAENGEWQAWCWLNLVLMLTAESPALMEGLNYFITTMPGWASADETTRHRIVATAQTYLADAESSLDQWFGKNPTPIHSNDLSAVRAMILLRQQNVGAYVAIPAPVWDKWVPVIVGFRLSVGNESSDDVRQLQRDALARAPVAFVSAVCKMLSMEKAEARASSDPRAPSVAHPFLVLRDLEGCWDDEGLKAALFEEMQESDLRPAEYEALLDALLKAGYQPALSDAIDRLELLDGYASTIAYVLLRRSPAAGWPVLWPKLLADDTLARAVLTRIADTFHHTSAFYADIGADAIADLYLLMVRLFPLGTDPPPPSGFVSPRQMITSFRDGAVRCLAAMGTDAAVGALMRLVAERPDIPLLPYELSRGDEAMRLKTWSPLTTKEVLALADRPDAKLITSASDLLEILVETLAKFALELHGAQTPVRGLWNLQVGTKLYTPIDENGLSDAVALYLQRELQVRGVFANREVEVTRRPGAPVGQRTDILVNTVRRAADGQSIDPITAVIEVKGAWNPELFTALEQQLVRDYMVDLRAPVGIYLVGWFNQGQWDSADYRRARVPHISLAEAQSRLDQQAAGSPEGFQVRAVVLDIKPPGA